MISTTTTTIINSTDNIITSYCITYNSFFILFLICKYVLSSPLFSSLLCSALELRFFLPVICFLSIAYMTADMFILSILLFFSSPIPFFSFHLFSSYFLVFLISSYFPVFFIFSCFLHIFLFSSYFPVSLHL